MHPDALRTKVLETGAHMGIAFDGDGDRVLMIDNRGTLVDGDELLFIIALARKQREALRGPVVGTHMSNLGLEQALQREGIAFHRAQVGDRYVLALLEEQGGILGGENSGHIICLDRTTTGDGIIAALQVLEALRPVDYDFTRLPSRIRKYPQTLVNIRTDARVDLAHPSIRSSVADVERQLNGRGRVLLRASGTEPVIRIMVEGEEAASLHGFAENIAAAVRAAATR